MNSETLSSPGMRCRMEYSCSTGCKRKQLVAEMNDLDKQRSKNKAKSELRESDWELRAFESKSDIEIMVYFYDHFDTGELIMAGFRKKDIVGLSGVSHSMEDITSGIDAAFKSYVCEPGKEAKTKWTEVIGGMLGLYMLRTKTYSKLKNMMAADDEMKQFIVLRYKNKQNQVASLRPFSLVSKSMVLSPEEIKQLAGDVIARDERVNSGYFNFNQVSNLRK